MILHAKKNKNTDNKYLYEPKNDNQIQYLKYLNDDRIKLIFSLGPAGTGKTLFACQKAISDLKNEKINKIIITRPVVSTEEDIGFLPGSLIKKMEPWTKPIFDIFLEHYSQTELNSLINGNQIEICPLMFMRGRTFKNSFIIADEMQNSSPLQMKMLLTRIGHDTKLIVTGDLAQVDILKSNGMEDFLNKFNRYNQTANNKTNIKIINFSNNDIERSEIVKNILDIYDNYNKTNYITATDNDCALIPFKDFYSKHFSI
jgi:phosphate starvation-inducible PhoH-like protein